MAKRDKLYTVNKWNKPFFEQERRKKLYGIGGSTDNYVWGLNTDQGLTRAGLGFVPDGFNVPFNKPNWLNIGQRSSNPYQEMIKTHVADVQNTGGGTVNIDSLPKITSIPDKPDENSPSWATEIAGNFITALPSILGSTGKAATIQAASTPFGEISTYRNAIEAGAKGATEVAGKGAINAINGSGEVIKAPSTVTKIGDFFKTKAGAGLALTAADLLAENTIDRWTTNPHLANSGWTKAGKVVGDIGAGVGSALISTGVGAGPGFLAWGIGKGLEQILKGAATSIENKDQVKNYINWANNLNINGSNEQIANMLAQYGGGAPVKAQGHAGWVARLAGTDVYKDAEELNNKAADATEDIYRKARHAFNNNNDIAYMHALNDYYSAAMGGRLNRKKCNCKATGGFLNNAMLDSASATGYNFLSDLTNMQMQNNQNKQDMGSSLGNSFTGLSNGTLFANGGNININPAHRGEFTAKAKRYGMSVQQFANYVLAHKDKFPTSTIRQAVFAKNSNTWKKAFGGKLNYGKDQDIRDNSFFDGASLYAIGGPLQAMSSNWSPGGNVTEINAGGQHEENPYEGVQVGVDPEGTPNLVEENEVIWNDYVFSNRLKVPKEVCKELRVGQKKDGFTFAEVAKKLLAESKERPNDPISKRGLDANMQKLEDAQEELKQKMEAEEAVEQFNSLPPEQQVAIMQQEGERAQDAVAQEQMAQQIQNLPPEQQQAIAQQMAMEQAQQQGIPQQGMSPEEQYAMQQQAVQDQYAAQRDARNQEILAQAAAMQDQAINSSAMGGKLYQSGGKKYIKGAKSHWETNAQGHRVLVPNTPFENTGFGGGRFGMAGGGAEWGDEPAPLAPKKRDWLAIDYKESFNDAYRKARKEKKKTFWFDGKEYSTDYNPNLTEEQVRQGMNRYQDKGLIIAPWEHAYGGPLCFGGKLFAEGGELNGQPQAEPGVTQQPTDTEMAKYSDEELQDMIDNYQEAESGEVKVTKGKLARLRKKAEKAQAELERRHSEENEEQHQEARQEPSQEELQAAAQAQAMQTQQPIEGQPQEGVPQEGMSPEQAMMMQQQMAGQMSQGSPEEMAAMEQQGQYGCGGKLYLTGGQLMSMFGLNTDSVINKAGWKPEDFGISSWYDEIPQTVIDKWIKEKKFPWQASGRQSEKWIPNKNIRRAMERGYNPFIATRTPDSWHEDASGAGPHNFTNGKSWRDFYGQDPSSTTPITSTQLDEFKKAYQYALDGLEYTDGMTLGQMDEYMKKSPYWKLRDQMLWRDANAAQNRLNYMAKIAANNAGAIKKDDAKKFSALGIYKFTKNQDGTYAVERKPGVTDEAERAWWDRVTSDYKYGDMYNTPDGPLPRDIYIDEDTGDIMYTKPGDGWTQVGNPYSSYVAGTNEGDLGYNQNIYFYKKSGAAANNGTTGTSNTDDTNYLTVGWKPRTNWTDYMLGALPGLTGLGMMLAQGKPDMSGIEAAANAYANSMGAMAPVHLTHGYMRPAIIDPRVTHNTLTAARLGTNRMLRNTGSAPSQAASILANDTNYQQQMGQNDLRDWMANREQEQKAAVFNEGVARANATFLNQGDQFNAQMLANAGERYANARYNAEKEKLAQENAWRAGILGNIGSAMTGLYNAYREGQNRNERDLLLASEVFGPTNGLLDEYYGIRKIDPKTGQIRRGPDTGKYWYNNGVHNQPQMSISAKGGKLNRKNKKRKGYTF